MSSPNISFSQLPSSIRKPGKYVEFNASLAVRTLPSNAQRLLIVAQSLATGTAPAGVPVAVFDDGAAATLFGRGSHAHLMVRAAIGAYRYARITVLPLADAVGATAASATVTLTGTATKAGSIAIQVGDRSAILAVPVGETAAQATTRLLALLAQQVDWPVVAAAKVDAISITARNAGTIGNDLVLSAISGVAGLTVATTAMAGGLIDPDLEVALATVFKSSDEIIVSPFANTVALKALRTHLAERGNAIEQRGAVGVYATTGTLAAATTLAASVNHERITAALLPGTSTPAFELAAIYAAVISSEEDPARPLNTLALTGVDVPPLSARLSRMEQEACLVNGVTPLEVGPGETVQIVRAITTYTLDPQGITDIAWLDLTTIRTMDYVRKSVRERLSLRFPREKLSARTAPRVRSEILDVLNKLEELEIVEEVKANASGLIVERDSQDPNRLNARIPTDVVNGLHVLAARLDLLL